MKKTALQLWIIALLWLLLAAPFSETADAQAGPRSQPGAAMTIYAPEQHDLYDGRFVLEAGRVYQVGRLNDRPGWDHIGNDASNTHAVKGVIAIDVDEINNTGSFTAKLEVPQGRLEIVMDRFHEFSPCQNGGIAAFIYEHGDSGCGDTNWPKSLLYVAGWGYGHATLNGKKIYEDYEIHFMVTQGMRDRETLKVNYPLLNKKSRAGAVNPTMQQLDFFIRSPEMDERNSPGRKVFDHFFAMEVTWK